MAAYYNENDPFAAQWLRNLVAAGHLPAGDIDERSILDVEPDDLRGYRQCHFFAGIGGWPLALDIAQWPADREAWSGSCPCQPLSSAGKRQGHADERHLWPAFYRLIAERRPAAVFGEQVGGTLGREWLSAVRHDLEGMGYAVGAADIPAASVGAPHIRQRLFWLANTAQRGLGEQRHALVERNGRHIDGRVEPGRLAHHGSGGRDAAIPRDYGSEGEAQSKRCDATRCGRLGYAGDPRLPARERRKLPGSIALDQGRATEQSSCSPWADIEWLACRDGKARPTQPGIFPLAARLPGDLGRLRAYGNAIVPSLAAEFIKAAIDII